MRIADHWTLTIGIAEKGNLIFVRLDCGMIIHLMTIGIVVVMRKQKERVRVGDEAPAGAFRWNDQQTDDGQHDNEQARG